MAWVFQHGDVLVVGSLIGAGVLHLHLRVARLEEAMWWVKQALKGAGYTVKGPNGEEVE